MLQLLRDNTQRQRLHARDGFGAVGAVAHHTCERRHFGNPAAVSFLFQFDGKRHRRTLARKLQPKCRDARNFDWRLDYDFPNPVMIVSTL